MQFQPPILCFEENDLVSFTSVRAAERYMEPIDVRDGVYTCFDSIGNRLDLEIDEAKQMTRIVMPTGRTPEPDVLRRLVLKYLKSVRRELVSTEELNVLVSTGLEKALQRAFELSRFD